MKIIPSLICAALTACNTASSITVEGVTVRTSGRLGGQGGLYVRSGNTEIATYDNNEESFREVGKTARFGMGAAQVGSVARSGIGAVRSVKNAATAAKASTAAGAETTKQAAIAADVTKARIAAEAPAPAVELTLPPIPQL